MSRNLETDVSRDNRKVESPRDLRIMSKVLAGIGGGALLMYNGMAAIGQMNSSLGDRLSFDIYAGFMTGWAAYYDVKAFRQDRRQVSEAEISSVPEYPPLRLVVDNTLEQPDPVAFSQLTKDA